MFTARYELHPYIKQRLLVFKGLNTFFGLRHPVVFIKLILVVTFRTTQRPRILYIHLFTTTCFGQLLRLSSGSFKIT